MRHKEIFLLAALLLFTFSGCSPSEELSQEELDALTLQGVEEMVSKTVSRPYNGEDFIPGKIGGTWNDVLQEDPKSFNLIIAERDSATSGVVSAMLDYLADYDPVKREWKPRAASFEIKTGEGADKLDVIYTLRDDLYWTWYGSDRKIKVTSDDIIFWYNEIEGDEAFNSSGYNGQFLLMNDGSVAHIDIEKIDERRFVFHFPRIVAEPILTTNQTVKPRMGYEDAKKAHGAGGVQDIFGINTNPREIPSMGKWHLTEYTAGQRLVYKRNPNYWEQDGNGVSVPYFEEEIIRFVKDENTQFLLFKEGKIESYYSRPEDLDELVQKQSTGFTVFNNEGSESGSFWTFNQNPKNQDKAFYEWFTKKEFRQAMSCLLNRDRIITQVYRGLAVAKLRFFPKANHFYNEDIELEYTYSPEIAVQLLSSIGIKQDSSGVMKDEKGRTIEFNLAIRSDSTIMNDIASIIRDDLERVGIKANIRVIEFQKMVEQLTRTFDWESLIMGLSGGNIFPTQGSNVWPSGGNLHMWHPLQESPATDWEARVDYLYNEGSYTVDDAKAKTYWDEYQRILLEQCPVIYLVGQRSFAGLQNRWDMTNVYFDNLNGFESTHIFLK
ncbi:MAG: ABC transporter substrate-binding protein [Treponema sp.]|jgi:peptide/nickel transport system substrate-binding protein|nr:ABC transporter substrate-binding protein [Treponema sp.]